MITKTIICLANSRKHGGWCIAGRDLSTGAPANWIRPVSSRPGREVSFGEQKFQDNTYPAVLDIISVPLLNAAPVDCHTENWILNPAAWWSKTGTVNWNQTVALAENPASLWHDGDSTYVGLNDQIEESLAANLRSSICMIHVTDLVIHVINSFEKIRVQARFHHRGTAYHLWITDPRFEDHYKTLGLGQYQIGECCLTVSLSEPHTKPNGGGTYLYKLVAAIVTP